MSSAVTIEEARAVGAKAGESVVNAGQIPEFKGCRRRRKKRPEVLKSGKIGGKVHYLTGSRQFERSHVIPVNIPTEWKRRWRGAWGRAAKAWRDWLTEEERQVWNVAGKKQLSRARAGQAGPLTGQLFFQRLNAPRLCIGREMMRCPSQRPVFAPSPVELSIRRGPGGLRIELRVCGPVAGDIMVFATGPCSARWTKCRKPVYLGLLPEPVDGVCDITELYVARLGEPEAGKRVFIRMRQQVDGWEGPNSDTSQVVPTAIPRGGEVHSPQTTVHSQRCRGAGPGSAECGARNPEWGRGRRLGENGWRDGGEGPCPKVRFRNASPSLPCYYRQRECGQGRGQSVRYRLGSGGEARGRRKSHWRELWRGG
jgi:hypothetical protein